MKPLWVLILATMLALQAQAQTVEIPARPGIVMKALVLKAPESKATLLMFAGGHGGLQLFPNGSMRWGENNFVVRTRQGFVDQGFTVILLDAPSDRQSPPFLTDFRQTPEHAADVKAAITWARGLSPAPVWLVGTSRGTQSVAYVATELTDADSPDGIVLTASILAGDRGLPVQSLPLERVRVPVLVVHHEQDGCRYCPVAQASRVIEQLKNATRKELMTFSGGHTSGDACGALAFHGFNGLETQVIRTISEWIVAR